MKPTYEDLQDEIASLRAKLEGNLPLAAKMQIALRLRPKESLVLALLLEHGQSSRRIIYSRCFEYDNGDGPFEKIVDVYICKLRTQLRINGVPGGIINIRSYGYSLTEPARAALTARFMSEEQALAA